VYVSNYLFLNIFKGLYDILTALSGEFVSICLRIDVSAHLFIALNEYLHIYLYTQMFVYQDYENILTANASEHICIHVHICVYVWVKAQRMRILSSRN
jgi:hypothetical protein